MKKRILAILLVLTMVVCSFPVNAFAADNSPAAQLIPVSSAIVQEEKITTSNASANSQLLVSRPFGMNSPASVTRGVSLPTKEYTFDGQTPYFGLFSDVKEGIYTNYYFTGYSKYNVSFGSVTVTSNCSFTFFLYNMSTGSIVGTPQTVAFTAGIYNSAEASFNTLASYKYCVFFRTDGNGYASGNIGVSYSY